MCAHAVRVALKGVNGVESVNVSLNRGNADVKLKPGNTATMAQLYSAVARNGFTNREATISARGQIVADAGGWKFQVSGTGESFQLHSAKPLNELQGKAVLLKGKLPPPEKGRAQLLEVISAVPGP